MPPALDTTVLQQLDVPILLIHGENTQPFLSQILLELKELLPNDEWLELENETHGLQFDNPEQFNAAVSEFINAH